MKKITYRIATLLFLLPVLLLNTIAKAQTPVLFSDNFEAYNINSLPTGWELFGTTSLATVQYDLGTTNKILRLNAGQTNPAGYAGEKIQKTLDNSYGDILFSYKIRTARLTNATNTTNCPNFNRIGFGGVAGVTNVDNNTASATTSIFPLALQGSFRVPTGLAFTPSGNMTLVDNVWYQVALRISRTSATSVSVSGTITQVSNNSLVKTISGSITTSTPTLLMNQVIFDIQAIYQYNYADLDDITVALPSNAPAASNVSITGTVASLQTLKATYTLTGQTL